MANPGLFAVTRRWILGAGCVLAVGCGQPSYGDAGADATGPEPQTFDVDNSGTATCPGELFNLASYGRATCGRAPQRCVTNQRTPGNRVICTCDGAMGARGTWACREERP